MKRILFIPVILVAMLFNACGAPSHQGMVRYNDQWLTREEYARITNAESPTSTSIPAPTPPAPGGMESTQLVFSLTGSGDEMIGISTKTTQTFHIDKAEWYIETNCAALDSGVPIVFTVSVFPKGQPVDNFNFVAIVGQTTPGLETNYVHKSGDFYLSIVAMNISTWSIKVYE